MAHNSSRFVTIFLVFMVAWHEGGIHAEEDIGFYYEYQTITAIVPEVNIAIDRVTLTDPVDQRIYITDNGVTVSAKIRIGSFVETGYVIGDRNWRLTFFAANSTNHRLSAEFPATLSDKQQAMDLDTSSTLTFNNVKGNLFFGSLNCSTFSRICVKLYESDEGLWVKGEKSFDTACTDISCNYRNRGASSGITSYFLLCICLQTAWMYII